MSERKLATIRRIKDIVPIAGADKIELILLDGWQCVAQKGLYEKGGLAIYFEIDSFLNAEDPRYASFESMFRQWDGKRGLRVKTIRLKGQLSQGLLMPVTEFPEIPQGAIIEGQDVTETLKIEKWESAAETSSNSGGVSGGRPFPSFIRKTNQDRAQNLGYRLQASAESGEQFEVTVKLDGSSLTVFCVQPTSPHYDKAYAYVNGHKKTLWQRIKEVLVGKEPVYGICSRNNLLPIDGSSHFHQAAKKAGLLYLNIGKSYAFQCEVVGPGIQGNYEKVDEIEAFVYDIFDIDTQSYLLPQERMSILDHQLINGVPNLGIKVLSRGQGIVKSAETAMQDILDFADGPGGLSSSTKREGVVFKSMTRDFSFKVISNAYLLKQKD